jgi:alpha-tubulin suppressor-like RCC1 family protein
MYGTRKNPNLNVHGDQTINGAQTINGDQTITGDQTINGELTVDGFAHFKNNIRIDTNTPQAGLISQLVNSYGNTGSGSIYRGSVAIGTDGRIYSYGNDGYGKQANGAGRSSHPGFHEIQWGKLSYLYEPGRFKKLEAAAGLGAGLTEDGEVWMWGYNGHGQQGVGNTTDRAYGQRANIPYYHFIIDICMGKSASNNNAATMLALTSTGEVYSWGYNSHGQCGRNGTTNNSTTYTPQLVNTFAMKIVRIFAVNGEDAGHCAAITDDGRLLMWGYNGYGQLGSGNTTNATAGPIEPVIGLNADEKIVHVYLNGHTYGGTQIVTSEGRVFGAGYNGHGQLGVGNTTQQNSFTLSTWWTATNADRTVMLDTIILDGKLMPGNGGCYGEWIGAHFWGATAKHSARFALASTNRLYAWGYGNGYSLIYSLTNTNSGDPYLVYDGSGTVADTRIKLLSIGGSSSYNHLFLNIADGRVLVGGYNGNYGLATSNNVAELGWREPWLPTGVQGKLKCVVGRGTTSGTASDWLMEDGTYYACGYSAEYSQGTNQNTSSSSLHFVEWN